MYSLKSPHFHSTSSQGGRWRRPLLGRKPPGGKEKFSFSKTKPKQNKTKQTKNKIKTTRWKRKVFPKHFDHQVIAGQPERSFNHHLSVGTGAPICDRCDGAAAPPVMENGATEHSRLLPEGWYRFSSPAGSLLPTECPGCHHHHQL